MRYIRQLIFALTFTFFCASIYAQTTCDQFVSSYTVKQDVCNAKLVHFKNVNPSATNANWNFGDGATATGLQVSHEFNTIGEYEVKMVVQYPGCSKEVIKKIPVHITLDKNLITTSDQTICPGQQVQLNSQSNNLDFCWLPADGLTDIQNRNPIVKPSVTTTYRLQHQLLGENLVRNPGFENGVADFYSEYKAMPTTDFGEAQYWVTTNPKAWHSGFQPCGDHTSGTGNMMVVNGSPGINVVVWSQKVNVVPNTIYSFSLWIASVNPAAPAKLRFQINGNVLNQEVNAGDNACQWIQVYALWNSGTSTQAEITVINDNIIASGNDYALDDISFSTQSISYDEVTITVSPEAIIAGDDVTICEGASTQLNASGGTTYSWAPGEGISNTGIGNPVASPTVTTTYIVTGTSDAGCVGTDDVTVTVNPKPIIDIGGNADICINSSYQIPGNVQGASAFSWSPATGLSDPTIQNPIATPATTTEYKLTATSDNQCVAEKSITVNVATGIDVSVSADVTICAGSSTELTASGAIKYSWLPIEGLSDPNVANPIATPDKTTTYTVTGTSDLGCTGSAMVTVTVNENPTIDLGSDAAYCQGGSYQIPGVATNATSISWSLSTGLSDATIANPFASPTSTTTYTVTATNGQCTAIDEITISVADALQIKTIDDLTICGDTTIVLTTTSVAGGKYAWSPATGLSDPTIASPTATLKAGTHTYKVTVTSADGCEGSDEVTIIVNDIPTINVGADAAYCIGGTYQIPGVATNATSISWSPATGLSDATIANPLASPTSTTVYTVTATNGQCTAKDEITISVADALQVKTIDDLTICGDTTIALTTTAVAGAKYIWSPATGLSDPTSASPLATLKAGSHTYKVTVTSADGCEGSDEVTIMVNDNPKISVGADAAYCIGGSYQIPGVATNATSISWSPATGLSDATIANPLASPTTTTTYTVTATNGQCTAKGEITINVAESLTINTISDTAICGGQASIELTTTVVPGASYKWSPSTGLSDPNIANPVASPTSTTTYVVLVTSDAGCSGTDSVTISMNDQPTVSAGADAAYCIGGSYQIPGVATNATTISWLPATGLSDAAIANPNASPTSTTTYIVTVTNGQCTAKDSITINVAESLTINTISDTAICGGQASVELVTTVVPGATYKWSPATGLSNPSIANPIASPTTTTKYNVFVTSASGCSGSDSVTISMNDQPSVSAGADAAYCIGGSYQIPGIATNATNISWSPATGLSDAKIINPIASPKTTTTYIVTATNGNCTAKDTMIVAVASSIQVTPINDTSVCAGNAVPLTGTLIQGATYQWLPATGLSNPTIPNPMASPATTTNYVLTVSTPDGCQGKDSVLVTVAENPVITMNNNATVCTGGTITLQAESPGAKQFQWSPSTGLSDARSSRPVASVNATTTYNVTVTNSSGCESTDDVTITAAPLPIVNISKPNDIDCAHGDVQLQASGGASYQWSPAMGLDDPNSANPIAKPTTSTEYTVTARSVDGCEAEASVMVDVKAYPTETLNIPSAFTPNGDGRNDCFGLRTANIISPFQFEVYNRWGQKVFETSNTSICWDGTFKGTAQPGDAYVWQVRVKGECGDTYKKGTVVLIR